MTKKKKDLSRIFTTGGRYPGGQGKSLVEDKIVFQYFVSEPWLINVLPGIMVSREANNRHLHTRHHRVEGFEVFPFYT